MGERYLTSFLKKEIPEAIIGIAIGAFLAYMAYRTFWHAALFGFLTFLVRATGTRILMAIGAEPVLIHPSLKDRNGRDIE